MLQRINVATSYCDYVVHDGLAWLSGYVPEQDATIVAKMKAAGAIILGKTAMPDFATSWFGYSSVSGETKNPYDLDRDPDTNDHARQPRAPEP